jgi:hypothetical protein
VEKRYQRQEKSFRRGTNAGRQYQLETLGLYFESARIVRLTVATHKVSELSLPAIPLRLHAPADGLE